MKRVRRVTGTVCPLDRADIDTDQIIPKQFLKRTDRTGFGPYAFYGWRYDDAGEPDPDFPMNRSEYAGASVMVAGANFGCGSSREHAVWALDDAGFEAIIAPSFADIFANNCTQVGLLTVELDREEIDRLLAFVDNDPDVQVTVDVVEERVTASRSGTEDPVFEAGFGIDEHVKHRLLHGLDDIDLTLQHEEAIAEYEAGRPGWLPRVSADNSR